APGRTRLRRRARGTYTKAMEPIALAVSPLRDASPREIVDWARTAEARGFEAVFIPESYCDSLAYAEAVALATTGLRVGTGITNVYLRQPTLLAQQAAAVQEFSGGRLLLGLGVGHRAVNEPLGIDMRDPRGRIGTPDDRARGGARGRRHIQPLSRRPLSARPRSAARRRGAWRAGRRRARRLPLHDVLPLGRPRRRAPRGEADARALRKPAVLREHARAKRLRGRRRARAGGVGEAGRRRRGGRGERRARRRGHARGRAGALSRAARGVPGGGGDPDHRLPEPRRGAARGGGRPGPGRVRAALTVDTHPPAGSVSPSPMETATGLATDARIRLAAVVALAVLVADQATKALVARTMLPHESIAVAPFFALTYVRNTGAAFGVLAAAPAGIRLPLFVGVTILAAAALVSYLRTTPPDQRWRVAALGGILGGALG